MIETNFNDLDDDFITLWSRYFLTNNYNEIKSDIIRLAEKGQINAIAMYYGFLDKNEIENEKIKKALDDYEYMDYNFYHAEAFRNEWIYKKGEQNFFKAKVSAESAFWECSRCANITKDPLVCNRVIDMIDEFNIVMSAQKEKDYKKLEKYSRNILKKEIVKNPTPQNLYIYAKNLFCPRYLVKREGQAKEIFNFLSERKLKMDEVIEDGVKPAQQLR